MPLAEKPAVKCRNENAGRKVFDFLKKWMQDEISGNMKKNALALSIGRNHEGEKRDVCQ